MTHPVLKPAPWWLHARSWAAFVDDVDALGIPLSVHRGVGTLVIRTAVDLDTVRAPRECIRVIFDADIQTAPRVYADKRESPHRYTDGRLCLWYPRDPRERRWEVQDGLGELIRIAAAHIIREILWGRYDSWAGPEQPHGFPEDRAA